MTVDDFIARLGNLGQEATNLSDILTGIGNEITTGLKQRAPVDTGALRSSISFTVDENTMTLEMLNYGVFQNYGVDGTKSGSARPVEAGIFGIPAGYKFKFKSMTIGGSLPFPVRKSIAERGLKPQQFFDISQLREEVTSRIEQELTRQFN